MNDLELLLRSRDNVIAQAKAAQYQDDSDGVQRADKNASIYDFMKMISKLVTLTLKDLNVEFIPDEEKGKRIDPDQTVDHPFITYKLVSRKKLKEFKPRVRESIREKLDDTDEERLGEVYGQKFQCIIQFNIFGSVYEQAEAVMERFEELIFTYTGFFKKNGVAEIIFGQQLTDEAYDRFRQTMSIRNLQYEVQIEKLIVMFKEKIKEIETLANSES